MPDDPADFDLIRFPSLPEGAFGALLQDGFPFAFTLERTFGQEVKIPKGLWPCQSTYFYRGGYDTYEILIPDHSRILFHKGNWEEDSEGCVLLGRRSGFLKGRPAVLESGLAFDEFMRRSRGRLRFTLLVQEVL